MLMDKKNELKIIGRNIKVERVRKGYSQEEFAHLVETSCRSISLIENGLQHPKLLLAVKIAKVLDVDINVFFTA